MTTEVFAVIDRVAAALLRGDSHCARDIIDCQRRRWETDGARNYAAMLQDTHDQKLRFDREADVWFYTADGLKVLGKITTPRFDLPIWPPVWHRAARPKNQMGEFDEGDTESVVCKVRAYHYDRRHEDGRPIYVEDMS